MRHGSTSRLETQIEYSYDSDTSFPFPVEVAHKSLDLLDHVPTVEVHGARLHALTEPQCVEFVLNALDKRRGGSIITMNLDFLRRYSQEESYAARYQRATLVTADGMPLIWASRLQGTPLPQRVTGSNLIWSLSAAAAKRGHSIYLLGGAPGTAEKTARVLAENYPLLHIAGASGEPFDFGNEDLTKLTADLIRSKPSIVYVALSSPKAEELIDGMRDFLPGTWWLGVGFTFSFVAGETPRAPLWMQQTGLEWLHRLVKEPRRLAKRYLIQGMPFCLKLLLGAAFRRLTRA